MHQVIGVSLTTQINFLLSFRTTSAARVIRSEEMPVAMRPRVPMEQGMMIIMSYFPEPEAKGAEKSVGRRRVGIFFVSIVFQFGMPYFFSVVGHDDRKGLPLVFQGGELI